MILDSNSQNMFVKRATVITFYYYLNKKLKNKVSEKNITYLLTSLFKNVKHCVFLLFTLIMIDKGLISTLCYELMSGVDYLIVW